MRLTEIESRLAEIKNEIDTPEANLDALDEEIRALQEERNAILDMAEKRKLLLEQVVVEGKVIAEPVVEERTKTMDIAEIRSTAEYRNAFLKSLLGKPLDEAEKRTYYTNDSASAGAAIPTQTGDMLFEKMVKIAPMLSEVTLLRVAGNVTFAAENARDAAALHTQNGDITPAGDTLVAVSLTGYEFNKVLRISKTVQTMSIAAFEGWLVDMLAGDIARIIEYYLINGSGSSEPQGVAYAKTWSTVNSISTTASMTYDNLNNLIALLPAGYDANAKFLCNKKFVYQQLTKIADGDSSYVLARDIQNGLRYNLFGYPVIVSDKVVDGEIYFGDFSKVVANLAQDITVESSTQSGFLANAIDYRGGVIFDSKVATAEAITRFKKNA